MIRNFKSLFIIFMLLAFSLLFYLNYENMNLSSNSSHNLGTLENDRYVFNHYNTSSDGITSGDGYDVAFDSNDDIGYVSANGGLSIGTKNDSKYVFRNYDSTTSGITNENGQAVAFDSLGDVGYASNNGGLSIGIKNNNNYTFTNYNSSIPGILGNDGTGVAFDNHNNVAYSSYGGGLSIGIKNNNNYIFTNYNSSVTGIGNDDGRAVAFDSNGNVAYAAYVGGLSIGIKHGNSYTFTNYKSNIDGITSNFGYGVAFDNVGNIGYVAEFGGLSIGIKNGDNYTFTNYNSSTPGITGNNGWNVAFNSVGDVGYASYGGGLSIGTKNGNSYTFKNYNTNNFSVSNNNGTSVAFDSNDDVAYTSWDGGGLDVGTTKPLAYIDTNNIIYEPNLSTSSNYSIEDFTIYFSTYLLEIVNSQNNTFIQITLSDSNGNYYIGYVTKDRTAPISTNRNADYDSYLQKEVIQSSPTHNFVAEKITNGVNGFAQSTTLNVSVKYGSSQNNLTEALPQNERTFSTPKVSPRVLPYVYKPQSFSTSDDNFIFDNKKQKYNISNISLSFSDNLKALLIPSGNPVNDFIEIDIYNGANIENSYIATVIYIVNTTGDKENAINKDNKLSVGNSTYQEIININTISNDVTNLTNLNINNLLPNTSYNVAITFGSSQKDREDMIDNESSSTLSFTTPIAPQNIVHPPNNTPTNNNGKSSVGPIVGGVVGSVVGVGIIGGVSIYTYKKGLFKKR